jgi:hypothetical protein
MSYFFPSFYEFSHSKRKLETPITWFEMTMTLHVFCILMYTVQEYTLQINNVLCSVRVLELFCFLQTKPLFLHKDWIICLPRVGYEFFTTLFLNQLNFGRGQTRLRVIWPCVKGKYSKNNDAIKNIKE